MEGRNLHLFVACFIVFNIISSTQSKLDEPLKGRLKYKESEGRLISGYIFLLDKRTILITQFSYKDTIKKNPFKEHSKWFKGVIPGEETMVDLEFDDGTTAQITEKYLGRNVYLKVPSIVESGLMEFSSIAIANERNEVKTSVAIHPEDLLDLPDHISDQLYQNGKFIFRYPKCCPLDNYLAEIQMQYECVQIKDENLREHFPVHEVRKKEFQTDVMENITYVPFYFNNWSKCVKVHFYRNDNVTLLANMEFLVPNEAPNAKAICLDYVKNDDGSLDEVVFSCLEDIDESFRSTRPNHSTSVFNQSPSVLLACYIIRAFIKF